jgi:adenylate kinase family enzyme
MSAEDDPLCGAHRVLLYGVTGSGKSTSARRISERTGIPWTSVDDLTWEPGWVQVPEDEQRRRLVEICAREEWLLDTAYSYWLDVPLATVELIVALDYPRWFSLQRLARRTLARVVDKKQICNGNVETVRGTLSRDSIIAWHFRSFRRKHKRMHAWVSRPPGRARVLRFTRAADLDRWIETLRPVGRSG